MADPLDQVWTLLDAARELNIHPDTPPQAGESRPNPWGPEMGKAKKQHGWGDISDDEYRGQRDETQAGLAQLPDGDRIVAFDAHRARILALPEAIAAASPERREELCRIVVERVVVSNRQVAEIEWKPAAQPFLKRQRECPQGDSNP